MAYGTYLYVDFQLGKAYNINCIYFSVVCNNGDIRLVNGPLGMRDEWSYVTMKSGEPFVMSTGQPTMLL